MPAPPLSRLLLGFRLVVKPAPRHWFVLATVSIATACGDGPAAPAGADYHIDIVGGDGQTGTPGWELDHLLIVRVTDANGAPAAGARVSFRVMVGEGSVSAATGLITGSGEAQTRWTLGPSAVRDQALRASVEGQQAAVTFTATALGPDEVDLVVAHGALGPLKGVVLARDDGNLEPLGSRALADTVVELPPMREPGVTLMLFAYANRPVQIAPAWTMGVDTVHVDLLPPVEVDIDFDIRDGSYANRIGQLNTQLDTMEEIWESEGMGLALGQATFTDATGGSLDLPSQLPCPHYVEDAIQVTVVSSIGGQTTIGAACFSGHVWLGSDFSLVPLLLAHEIGHTFGLLHQATGLMRITADERAVRDGEVYRAHFYELSALNTIFSSQPVAQRRDCGLFGVCLIETFELGPD